VNFDFRQGFSAFSRDSAGVPTFVTGVLSGSAEAGDEIALAVNGRVAAVTRSYQAGASVRVGAILPVSAFREGANRVEAFAVSGSGAETRLAGAGRAQSQPARLERVSGGEALVGVAVRPIPVDKAAADGFIDSVKQEGNSVNVAGWATDAAHDHTADRVLLFGDGRLIQAATPAGQRDDLAAQFGSGVGLAGFEFTGVDANALSGGSEGLRVFAVVGDRASELRGGAG
jgi:hypothetical protein